MPHNFSGGAKMDEIWKPVVGFELLYEVSSLGRVRNTQTGHVLKPGQMNGGHVTVSLGRENSQTVHSIVMNAFVGPCPDGLEIRHLDGVPMHNMLFNLAYGTRAQNIQDKKWHGTPRKLTVEQVRIIKVHIAAGRTEKNIAKEFGVAHSLIHAIKHGKVHSDV